MPGRVLAILLVSTVAACGDGSSANIGSAGCRKQVEALQACGLRGEGLGFCYSDDSLMRSCYADCAAQMSCEELNSCDEPDCYRECWEKPFPCDDGSLLYIGAVCDGTPHCEDGEDERGCRAIEFRCEDGSGQVLPASVVCDGTRDCEDGSDEECAAKLVPCSNPTAGAATTQP